MEAPRKIGKYEILEEISHGSITSVYKAYQPDLKRVILIKKLHQKLVNEEDIRERFFREAQVYAQINHPNIVSVFDFHSSEEGTYLVLEFIKGSSLAELINGKPFPLEVTFALINEILKGLKYAHDKGIVHRDIKPDNLLISEDGLVKVSDFGLAVFEGATSLTRQGMVVGTPAYMSPEQAAGKRIDKNSDLFSLGIVFFELLTGVNPYKTDNFSACIKKIISDPPPKLVDYRADLPLLLEKILARMLEKSPGKRYQKSEEIAEDLKSVDIGISLPNAKEIIARFFLQRDNYSTSTIKVTSTIARNRALRRKWIFSLSSIFLVLLFSVLYIFNVFTPRSESSELEISAQQTAVEDDSLLKNSHTGLDSVKSADTSLIKPPLQKSPADYQEKSSPADNRNNQKTPSIVPVKSNVSLSVDDTKPEHLSKVKKENTAAKEKEAAETPGIISSEPGELLVTCFPWADVYLDGKLLGQPPFARPFKVDPGRHLLIFIRPDYPVVSQEINISPEEKSIIDVNLWEHLGVLKVSTTNTWAEIWIDGKMVDRTPRADPLILPLGKHTIELKNPGYEIFSTTLEFVEGKKDAELLSVTLAPKQ